MADWKVQITAPNGAVTNMTVADGDLDSMTTFFADTVRLAGIHDAEPLEGKKGTAVVLQPCRQAVSQKRQ